MATLTTIQDRVIGLVQDDEGVISTTERDLFIEKALQKINDKLPKVIAEDENTDGTDEYSLPSLWVDRLSEIHKIYWEYDDDDPLEPDTYQIVTTPTGEKIRFISDLTTGKQYRVVYTTTWTCTSSTCDLPDRYANLVEYYATALYCDALASYYSQTSDSSITADVVNYRSKAGQYQRQSQRFMDYFENGLDDILKKPLLLEFDWDLEMINSSSRTPLTHGGVRF